MPAYLKNVSVALLRRPLIQPFRTALGEHKILENVLLRLTFSDGTRGSGEAAIATHITGETAGQTIRNLKKLGGSFLGRDLSDHWKVSAELHERLPDNKAALAAFETALVDALTRQWKIPLWKFFGFRHQRLATDITVVIADLEETENSVQKFYRQGFRAFKVKIGRDFDLDIKRVLAVRRLAPQSAIYLDANQGYSSTETLRFLNILENKNIRPVLIEQPVPRKDRDGLKRVTRSTKVPVCADESVRSLAEARRVIKEKAAGIINIKLMKTGIFESRMIALAARSAGVELMIGGMMETSLAMTAAAHLGAGLGCFKYIDLDTPFFIKGEVERNPCLSTQGIYDLAKVKFGIGITV